MEGIFTTEVVADAKTNVVGDVYPDIGEVVVEVKTNVGEVVGDVKPDVGDEVGDMKADVGDTKANVGVEVGAVKQDVGVALLGQQTSLIVRKLLLERVQLQSNASTRCLSP